MTNYQPQGPQQFRWRSSQPEQQPQQHGNPYQQQYQQRQQEDLLLRPITSTVLITLFFGLFGLIPATMNTNRARDLGIRTTKYWKAFWWTIGASVLAWILFWVVLAAAANSASSSLQRQYQSAINSTPSYAANAYAGQDVTSEVMLAPATCDPNTGDISGVVSVDNSTSDAQSVYITIDVTDDATQLPAGTLHVWNNGAIQPGQTWTYTYNSSGFDMSSSSCGVSVESATLQ